MTLKNVLARILLRLRVHAGISVFRIHLRPLGGAARIPCLQDNLQVRELSPSELALQCADPELELREPQVRAALFRGDRCLGAFADGKLVGYTWLAYGTTPHVNGVWTRFGAEVRYSYKSFVRPAYRGKRILQALHAFADDPALHGGKGYAVDYVDLENFASSAALERAGSRVAGYAGYFHRFGVFFDARSPGAIPLGVRFYAAGNSIPREVATTLSSSTMAGASGMLPERARLFR